MGATLFRNWQAALPSSLEVCAVQLPGRESRLRETPFSAMNPLVEALLPALQPLMDRPFAFFGHSMGSAVAAELTVRLAQVGGPQPTHLFVSGRRAPHLPDPEPPLGDLPDEAFLSEINRRYGGIPREILAERELLELLVPGLRADIRALESYRPSSPLTFNCPVSVFGGSDDTRATHAQLTAWGDQARGAFRVRLFPGGHFYLNEARSQLLADIAARSPA
jgi:surfactin synthase thioesterase subunit